MGYTGGENQEAWEVTDAPSTFIELLKKSITGIEINFDRLEGKFKMNQEMGKGDREGVVHGFEALGTEDGHKMARTVEERGAMKDARASERATK
jgi:transcriptional regulator